MTITLSKMLTDHSPQPRIFADLHIHSRASDGEYSPSELAGMLMRNDIRFAALADHDSISGFDEFEKAYDGIVLTGVEFSVEYRNAGLHLLAYGFDPANKELNECLTHFRKVRFDRICRMIDRLAELGMPLRLEDINKDRAASSTLGRPHIARALMAAGHVKTFHAAFQKYIGDGKPAYIPKARLAFEDAMQIIRKAGGISILAHPGLYLNDVPFEELMKLPVDGFEVYHPNHSTSFTRILRDHCLNKRIPYSGGSDFHDLRRNKVNVIGKYGLQNNEWKSFKDFLNAHCSCPPHG